MCSVNRHHTNVEEELGPYQLLYPQTVFVPSNGDGKGFQYLHFAVPSAWRKLAAVSETRRNGFITTRMVFLLEVWRVLLWWWWYCFLIKVIRKCASVLKSTVSF